ncbi:MAG: type II secretion system protein [Planctomycetaceae bacterium]
MLARKPRHGTQIGDQGSGTRDQRVGCRQAQRSRTVPVDAESHGVTALRLSHPTPARASGLKPRASRLAGFTLVELLIVVVIIGMLLALLVPAINQVRRRTNEARVITEIKQLESAVGAFKTRFGVEPPSRYVIYLTAAGWDTGVDGPGPAMKGLTRRIWPQFDFTMPAGSFPPAWAGAPYVRTDGAGNPYVLINAGECLLFFLGGIPDGNGALKGFSKDPAHPFAPTGSNRDGPFLELDIGRIRDIDANGMNEYFDPIANQTSPYLYFSAYEGKGYRPVTVGTALAELPIGTFVDIYRVSSTVVSAGPGSSTTLAAHKPQTFQIISPGYDGQYGSGGVFNPNLPGSGLTNSAGTADQPAYDNLTNFNGSRLNP